MRGATVSVACDVCYEEEKRAPDEGQSVEAAIDALVMDCIEDGWSSDSDGNDYCPMHAEINPESGHFSSEALESHRDSIAIRGWTP